MERETVVEGSPRSPGSEERRSFDHVEREFGQGLITSTSRTPFRSRISMMSDRVNLAQSIEPATELTENGIVVRRNESSSLEEIVENFSRSDGQDAFAQLECLS